MPEFQPCETCEMRGTCRSIRHCAGKVGQRVDAAVATWREQLEAAIAQGLDVRQLLDQVVAVRT